MTVTEKATVVSFQEYLSLQSPVVSPSMRVQFDSQIEKFVGLKLATYNDADPFRAHLTDLSGSILFVPPQPRLDDQDKLNHVVSLIVLNDKAGRNYLNASALKDEIEIPSGAHLMVDVEDGFRRRNVRPSENRVAIQAENRSPYNTWRGIAHCIWMPEVLTRVYMDLVASRYESGHWPGLYLCGGQPELYLYWNDFADTEWGAPSCGRMIGG